MLRDSPINAFLQFLAGQTPDQVALGDLHWFTVPFYWMLLIGGIALAVVNWRRHPGQRTAHHLSVFSLRILASDMWWQGTL